MKIWSRLFILLLVSVALTASALYSWLQRPLLLPVSAVEFTIAPGSSLRTIAQKVYAAGIPVPPMLFNLVARAQGRAGRIKAGTYRIESGMTPLALIDKMERGDVMLIEVIIPEGLRFAQMRHVLASNADLKHDAEDLTDTELLRSIGATEFQAEGLFFPDSYRFARGTAETEIYKQAYLAQRKHLDEAWQKRSANLPLATPYQALILASIIEKETGSAADRALIAAVFLNRLRVGMPLQTDPTVIYGLGQQYDGNLHKADLVRDTAYNTYLRTGLPPTPIAMPGLASINAALNPAPSEALYFVARGDGSSQFSRTLNEHNLAVDKFQRNQKP